VAASGRPLTLWNRTVAKAREALRGGGVEVAAYDPGALAKRLLGGDVVVSMLPAPMHPEIARLCLECGAHLVTTSYLSPAMRALDDAARARGLSFVNEAGLDPGLDHMMAHQLVSEYRAAAKPGDVVSFYSYCGGIPANPGPFTYKFSWSPAGVLRALTNPARSLVDGVETTTTKPWTVVKEWSVGGETFEVYPNRDSLPYVEEYGFDKSWKLGDFVRGTIRARGWKAAWAEIFGQIETAQPGAIEALSDELWKQHQYGEGDPDRVVLVVRLVVTNGGRVTWRQGFVLDEEGTADRTAMAYLVSTPAALAVEDVLSGRMKTGVHGAPESPEAIARWFGAIEADGIRVRREA
jgi:saccharopine dehydrogenase (NADP+, L-glutamate forming)